MRCVLCRVVEYAASWFPSVMVARAGEANSAVKQRPGNSSDPKLTVEPGHPWTPPFGLDRVGRPWDAVVEVPSGAKPAARYEVAAYRDGKEIWRQNVTLAGPASPAPSRRFGRVKLADWPTEVALLVRSDASAQPVEVARAQVKPPAFEAEAAARPDRVIPPVDLGTIFPPADWLLLAGGQRAEVQAAALSRVADHSGASLVAWYESAPDKQVKTALALLPGQRAQARLSMAPAVKTLERDALHVAIVDRAGKEIWRKDIRVMLVPDPPKWPAFGAVRTKLRYDAPIPVAGGKPIPFDKGWDPKLDDVVVFCPNGARFVAWRGSSYCPFWAGPSNTGFSYEWAEISGDHMVGRHDCVEPLQDKELRYGRVEIVESTAAARTPPLALPVLRSGLPGVGRLCRRRLLFLPRRLWDPRTHADRASGRVGRNQRVHHLHAAVGLPVRVCAGPLDRHALARREGRDPLSLVPQRSRRRNREAESRRRHAPVCTASASASRNRLAAICYSPYGSSQDLPGFAPSSTAA